LSRIWQNKSAAGRKKACRFLLGLKAPTPHPNLPMRSAFISGKIRRAGLAGTLLRYNYRLMKAIHPATILAVDDSDAQLYFVSRVLRHAGFEVRETKSGSDTLKMAEDQPDQIVFGCQPSGCEWV
jgi:hypothetical protein